MNTGRCPAIAIPRRLPFMALISESWHYMALEAAACDNLRKEEAKPLQHLHNKGSNDLRCQASLNDRGSPSVKPCSSQGRAQASSPVCCGIPGQNPWLVGQPSEGAASRNTCTRTPIAGRKDRSGQYAHMLHHVVRIPLAISSWQRGFFTPYVRVSFRMFRNRAG